MPKVSVIIPVYGVEPYIERCAISLFEQTLDDMEYIFIDDCTKDKSIEILYSVMERYPHRKIQTKVMRMPVNSGLPRVRQCGIRYATGDFIAHCDSDDWVDKTAYEKLYNQAIADDSDIIFCNYNKGDDNHKVLISRSIDISSKEALIKSISKSASWNLWGGLARLSLYVDNHLIFPECNNGEDFALMFQLIYFAKSFSIIHEPLYYYFQNPNSITNTPTNDAYVKRLNDLVNNTELVIEFLKRNSAIGTYKDIVICYKLYCRTKISALTNFPEYYNLWEKTYPELSLIEIIRNPIASYKTKWNYITVKLKLYPILHKLISK